MIRNIHAMSLALGIALGSVAVFSIGAAATRPAMSDIFPVRFLVLEVTEKGELAAAGQPVVLRLSPHYGKISQQGLDFRMANETQELSLVTFIPRGYEIRRGDIIGFQVYQHLKLSPGSRRVRHLPSGGQELVP